jgi:hypothetical protein
VAGLRSRSHDPLRGNPHGAFERSQRPAILPDALGAGGNAAWYVRVPGQVGRRGLIYALEGHGIRFRVRLGWSDGPEGLFG